ncbi:hypothetical protein MDA_GLEAN10006461 [Myotis davidii]|uniref:Uncharacterized protein n=1 Tax=Myotis davidii TaxID=225400 RepID=L5LFQ7_MYODS|nr:hypothetical protein MDA_GLEAN10006461 [Myotis davidii]
MELLSDSGVWRAGNLAYLQLTVDRVGKSTFVMVAHHLSMGSLQQLGSGRGDVTVFREKNLPRCGPAASIRMTLEGTH